ncbi:gliding motility protein [Streptomyces sp. PCS3-D2]|uniref:gliding motility protein n=1 Tax=unclassified Streptomyces TaxID=2593676 RepID=UPI0004474B8A
MTEGVATAAPAAESGAAGESEPAAAQSEPAEAVEIPKQQSAEVAADSEAGEGART